MLGWCYLVALTVFIVLKGKNYYLAPIYPMLLAAGAITIESGMARFERQTWLKTSIIVFLLAGATWATPWVVPVLPVDQFIGYMEKNPLKTPRTEDSHSRAVHQQTYA